jgi:hypothetical protein
MRVVWFTQDQERVARTKLIEQIRAIGGQLRRKVVPGSRGELMRAGRATAPARWAQYDG